MVAECPLAVARGAGGERLVGQRVPDELRRVGEAIAELDRRGAWELEEHLVVCPWCREQAARIGVGIKGVEPAESAAARRSPSSKMSATRQIRRPSGG